MELADFKEVCHVTVAYPPPAQRSEPSYRHSQKPTGRHDIIKLHYTDHQVYTTSRTAVDFKENYGLSDRRGWWDGAIDCCLLSIGHNYWRK